jgi:hypothetical protein
VLLKKERENQHQPRKKQTVFLLIIMNKINT